MNDVPEELGQLFEFLKDCTAAQQIEFWTEFLKVHRRRIANTEAELSPALLRGVEEHITYLKTL